jgi:hypothetical protein
MCLGKCTILFSFQHSWAFTTVRSPFLIQGALPSVPDIIAHPTVFWYNRRGSACHCCCYYCNAAFAWVVLTSPPKRRQRQLLLQQPLLLQQRLLQLLLLRGTTCVLGDRFSVHYCYYDYCCVFLAYTLQPALLPPQQLQPLLLLRRTTCVFGAVLRQVPLLQPLSPLLGGTTCASRASARVESSTSPVVTPSLLGLLSAAASFTAATYTTTRHDLCAWANVQHSSVSNTRRRSPPHAHRSSSKVSYTCRLLVFAGSLVLFGVGTEPSLCACSFTVHTRRTDCWPFAHMHTR